MDNHNTSCMGNSVSAVIRTMDFFAASGTVLRGGRAVCVAAKHVSAATGELITDPCGKRNGMVQVPSNINNRFFGGVVDHTVVVGDEGYTPARIHLPGSVCPVYLMEPNAVLGKIATFIVGGANAGCFTASYTGKIGRGCVRLLQTNAAAGLVLAEVLDGPESGGVEFVTPPAAGGAFTCMDGGLTVLEASNLAANATWSLAAADVDGLEKSFYCNGTMGSFDVVVSVTGGLQIGGGTALASISFDAVGEKSKLVYHSPGVGGVWMEQYTSGAVKSAT